MTRGDSIFLVGVLVEIVGLQSGVSTAAVAWSMIGYGAVLLWTGYLS